MTSVGISDDWCSTLCNALDVLREEVVCCDTTIVGNDQGTFRVHACVLAAASPTLKTYLRQATGHTYVVRVDHMSSSTWQGVLQFVYKGELCIAPGSSVASLMKAANTLQIPALQTALLAKPILETRVDEKQVVGEIALVEPCAASELNEEYRSSDTLPSVTDHKVDVRRVTAEETVTQCQPTPRQKSPKIRCKESVDAISELTTDSEIKGERNSDDSANESEDANEVDTPAAAVGAMSKYLCKLCGRTLTTNASLRRHMLVHNDDQHRCDTCHLECTSLYALRKHSRTHADEKPNVRSTSFSSIASSPHRKKIHTGVKPHVCDLCDDRFRSLGAWKMHRCSDTSNTHMKINAGGKPYVCDLCDDRFSSLGARKVHRRTHTSETEDAAGGAKRTYLCNVCGRVLATSGSLKKHMRVHSKSDRPYRCETCHFAFMTRHALRKHSRTHTGEKPYRCHVCGKCFSSHASLPYHMKIHTGERPFECDLCDSVFRSRSSLKVHRRTHTGEKPYPCSMCPRSFVTANTRMRHEWMHEGIKPYNCDLCEKAYTSSTKLKVHRRIHTGEMPFMCDICGLRFIKQAAMKTHVAGHHESLQRCVGVQLSTHDKGLVIEDVSIEVPYD